MQNGRKWLSVLLAAALLCGMLPAMAEEAGIIGKTVPLYLIDAETEPAEIHLSFLPGQEEIPFVTAEEMCRVMDLVWQSVGEDADFEITLMQTGTCAVLGRGDVASAYIDFENGKLGFSQYDRFFASSVAVNMLDAVVTGSGSKTKAALSAEEAPEEELTDEEIASILADFDPEEAEDIASEDVASEMEALSDEYDEDAYLIYNSDPDVYLLRHSSAFECSGDSTDLDLTPYQIPTPVIDGVGYLPMQTFSDLFMAPSGCALCWNGEIVALAAASSFHDSLLQLTELGDIYYSAPRGPRSQALTEFNYNELCLALDFHYGLKEEHGITDFNSYFTRSGLITELLDPDAQVSSGALAKLCMSHFADGHSALSDVSPYADPAEQIMGMENMSADLFKKVISMSEYYMARKEFYPDIAPGYEEVGNTAYVTFDRFYMDLGQDYYSADIPETFDAEEADTMALLIYANRQIHRENSPIENVVIDLSCNGGGYLDVAMSICAWALGVGTSDLQDMSNGAKGATVYEFDADLDHMFGSSGDSVNSKNVFCLISPVSFSCGNLVPASFKNSGKVTLIGKPSSGGACVVQCLSTADGSLLCVSGRLRVNTSNNGTYYSVDAGVEPHYYLPKAAMFFDREKLTEYINSLIW